MKTKLETLKNLQEHIKKYPTYNKYRTLDIALAHCFGGANWGKNENKIITVLYNLNRLLEEKGPEPTEEDLKNYIEDHSLDILYIPGAIEKLLSKTIFMKFALSMERKNNGGK